jgi:hypothetical protein
MEERIRRMKVVKEIKQKIAMEQSEFMIELLNDLLLNGDDIEYSNENKKKILKLANKYGFEEVCDTIENYEGNYLKETLFDKLGAILHIKEQEEKYPYLVSIWSLMRMHNFYTPPLWQFTKKYLYVDDILVMACYNEICDGVIKNWTALRKAFEEEEYEWDEYQVMVVKEYYQLNKIK